MVTAAFIVPVQIVAAFLQRDYLGGTGLVSLFSDPSAAESALDSGSTGQAWATLVAVAATVLVLPFVAGAVSRIVSAAYLGERMSAGRGPAGGAVSVVGVHRRLAARPPAGGRRVPHVHPPRAAGDGPVRAGGAGDRDRGAGADPGHQAVVPPGAAPALADPRHRPAGRAAGQHGRVGAGRRPPGAGPRGRAASGAGSCWPWAACSSGLVSTPLVVHRRHPRLLRRPHPPGGPRPADHGRRPGPRSIPAASWAASAGGRPAAARALAGRGARAPSTRCWPGPSSSGRRPGSSSACGRPRSTSSSGSWGPWSAAGGGRCSPGSSWPWPLVAIAFVATRFARGVTRDPGRGVSSVAVPRRGGGRVAGRRRGRRAGRPVAPGPALPLPGPGGRAGRPGAGGGGGRAHRGRVPGRRGRGRAGRGRPLRRRHRAVRAGLVRRPADRPGRGGAVPGAGRRGAGGGRAGDHPGPACGRGGRGWRWSWPCCWWALAGGAPAADGPPLDPSSTGPVRHQGPGRHPPAAGGRRVGAVGGARSVGHHRPPAERRPRRRHPGPGGGLGQAGRHPRGHRRLLAPEPGRARPGRRSWSSSTPSCAATATSPPCARCSGSTCPAPSCRRSPTGPPGASGPAPTTRRAWWSSPSATGTVVAARRRRVPGQRQPGRGRQRAAGGVAAGADRVGAGGRPAPAGSRARATRACVDLVSRPVEAGRRCSWRWPSGCWCCGGRGAWAGRCSSPSRCSWPDRSWWWPWGSSCSGPRAGSRRRRCCATTCAGGWPSGSGCRRPRRPRWWPRRWGRRPRSDLRADEVLAVLAGGRPADEDGLVALAHAVESIRRRVVEPRRIGGWLTRTTPGRPCFASGRRWPRWWSARTRCSPAWSPPSWCGATSCSRACRAWPRRCW